MEYLTKQNHDLEEQMCQKNVGLNTLEEDQESTNVVGIRKGRKVTTPQVDQSDRTQAVRLSWIQLHLT